MRCFLTCVVILLAAANGSLAQSPNKAYKLFEFEKNGGGGCVEYFRVMDLFDELKKQPESKGLIVIYAGDKKELIGNATAYAEAAKEFIVTTVGTTQISVVVAEGKNFFNEEFWVVPKDAALSNIRPATLNWDELTYKYHFSTSCLQCEPSYHSLTDFQPNFEDYANILRQYPKHIGLVTVHSRRDAKQVAEELTARRKLPRHRYRIRLLKKASDGLSLTNDLFIMPQKSTQALLSKAP